MSQTNTKTLRPYPGAMLNPKVDPIFKSLFTQNSEASNAALTAFLSVMLEQNISDVTITQNELPIESERDKQAIFDISCKSEAGINETECKVLNVEMQGLNDLDSFDNRSEYYVAHLLNHNVRKGMTWRQVPEAMMISVLNFVYDDSIDDGFLTYTMRLEDGKGLKSARMKIIYLELPKYKDIPDEPVEKLTTVEKWAKFFLYADCKEKAEYIRKLADSEEGIMYAQTALDSISQSEAEWIRERDYWDAVMTERTIREEAEIRGLKSGMEKGLQQGIQQGIKQGIQQGIQQNRKETAKSFYANGVSIEIIAKSLNMTIEQVQEIVKDVEVTA
jgi:predicted transposase/invertase (TIGR01784 family)